MPNLTLEQILDRTEALGYLKKYDYIKQYGMSGKPAIISGTENLKIFPLKIKLHHSFCNPENIIKEIEQKAENREIINYFQNGEFIGNYVISDFKVNICQKNENMIVFAEIDVNLLEKINTTNSSDLFNLTLLQAFSISSTPMITFITKANQNLYSNIYQTALNNINTNTSLSQNANKTLIKLSESIINDIQKMGIYNSSQIISGYTQNLNLSKRENEIIKQELEKISKIIVSSCLRRVT